MIFEVRPIFSMRCASSIKTYFFWPIMFSISLVFGDFRICLTVGSSPFKKRKSLSFKIFWSRVVFPTCLRTMSTMTFQTPTFSLIISKISRSNIIIGDCIHQIYCFLVNTIAGNSSYIKLQCIINNLLNNFRIQQCACIAQTIGVFLSNFP